MVRLDSRNLPFTVTLETQNFRPPQERELIFSTYDYQGTEVFGIDLQTDKWTNYSNAPGIYAEPEGIFPSGDFTTVESDLHNPQDWHYADIYKLALDGSGRMERLTHFADVPTYRASNPVISDDGRYMAFQMGRSGEAAGTGFGIFLYDFAKAEADGGD
jgi:Tol biopolymer transport system component